MVFKIVNLDLEPFGYKKKSYFVTRKVVRGVSWVVFAYYLINWPQIFCIVLWGEQLFLHDNYITLWMLVMFLSCCIGMISLIKTLVFLSVIYLCPFNHNLAIKNSHWKLDSMPIKLVYYQLDTTVKLDPNPILTRIYPNLTINWST